MSDLRERIAHYIGVMRHADVSSDEMAYVIINGVLEDLAKAAYGRRKPQKVAVALALEEAAMGEVIKFYPKDAAKNPDAVLEQAVGVYNRVFVIGFDRDGNLDVRASLGFKMRDIFFAIEAFKHKVLNGDYGTENEYDGD